MFNDIKYQQKQQEEVLLKTKTTEKSTEVKTKQCAIADKNDDRIIRIDYPEAKNLQTVYDSYNCFMRLPI